MKRVYIYIRTDGCVYFRLVHITCNEIKSILMHQSAGKCGSACIFMHTRTYTCVSLSIIRIYACNCTSQFCEQTTQCEFLVWFFVSSTCECVYINTIKFYCWHRYNCRNKLRQKRKEIATERIGTIKHYCGCRAHVQMLILHTDTDRMTIDIYVYSYSLRSAFR